MSLKKKLSLLIGKINSNSKKVIKFKYIYHKKLDSVFKILIEQGFIYGYSIEKKQITLYCKPRFKHYSLHLIPKSSVYVSYYKIKSLMYKNPNNIFFLSTNIGLLSNKKIVDAGIGGYLFLVLNQKDANF